MSSNRSNSSSGSNRKKSSYQQASGNRRNGASNAGGPPVAKNPGVSVRPRNRYDAGSTRHRLSVWTPGYAGPNYALLADLDVVRARSRDATRNNGWIKRGINSWVSNEIGTGIVPRSLAPDENFRAAANELWDEWMKVADADGVLDFYGLLSLASRTRIEGGEIFIRLRPRSPDDGLPVPLQLQFLEPEFCPANQNQVLPNGRTIRAGIEFDGRGKRRAYWMHRSHPGEKFSGFEAMEMVAVPASSVIHHYAPLRPGQIRGVPWTVQALIKARDFDDYDDAELTRKKNRASYTAAITRQVFTEEDWTHDPFTGEPLRHDQDNAPVMDVEPGSMVALLPGEDLKFFEGDPSGAGYADFVRQQLLGLAASMDLPYEFLTGDMSKVNDRLMRVILNEFHRILEQSQWHLVIPQVCNPVWVSFVDLAVLSGALPLPADYATRRRDYLKVEWRPQRWEYIHPVQDVQARQMEVQAGFTSRSQVVAERGESAEDIDKQNAEDQARAEKLGLKYSTHSPAGTPAPAPEPEGAEA
jgi:lambda family phage portal protein